MESPQAENGFLQIPNEIAEKFAGFRISGEEWMVLWAILRKTIGWRKAEDRMSLSQFAVMTGLKRQTAQRALSKLASRGVITVIKNDDSQINTYRFNKRFDEWKLSSKKMTVTKNDDRPTSKKITGVIKKGDGPTSFLGHTKEKKDTSTKDTLQKKDGVPYQAIIDYLNLKTGKKFTLKPKDTIRHINARWDEGYTLEDFKTAIDNKCAAWLMDSEMAAYLRPETLFGKKFEAYLNETKHPMAGAVSETTLRNIAVLESWSPPS